VPLIKAAFEMIAGGLHSAESVRKHINLPGLRTTSGAPVPEETFRRILRNELYGGVVVWANCGCRACTNPS
jgi:hypothetical protein